jgi:alpha-glucosidase (family GH31 glycosyl hydrolase)
MYYEYPNAPEAYLFKHQYYFGSDMIVAPITEPMHDMDKIVEGVWLPEGDWYDYRNNVIETGPTLATQFYDLDEIPVYVKAGSIIPTQTAKHRITGSVMDTLLLTVYPYNVYAKGAKDRNDSAIVEQQASFNLYEDDGTTENYKQNICSYTRFTYNRKADNNTFTIEPDGKTFTGQVPERCYVITIMHSVKPRLITVNTQPTIEGYDWFYDAAKKVLTMHVPKQKLGKIVVGL